MNRNSATQLLICGVMVWFEAFDAQSNIAFLTFCACLTFATIVRTMTTITRHYPMLQTIQSSIIVLIESPLSLVMLNLQRKLCAIISCYVPPKLEMSDVRHIGMALLNPSILHSDIETPRPQCPPPFVLSNF